MARGSTSLRGFFSKFDRWAAQHPGNLEAQLKERIMAGIADVNVSSRHPRLVLQAAEGRSTRSIAQEVGFPEFGQEKRKFAFGRY